jgi:GTPase Era involved in 16S rRNA processing
VVLKLFVKVTPKWTQNKQMLKDLGYALPEDRA